ncbi:AAA family ATPase [Tenacibaculum maritimum]|uniref:ATP-binding protein n=1 Tax=Tenacibaculum maritimum TaxID=107401 RepID=UPI0012E4844D|nr:ATP-binding protein [Tenacibaculum maritimum]CAA0259829.1 AAA family ATPase [Tenacibaculum maritimum]
MLQVEIKERIVSKLIEARENYPSDKKHAVALGINNAQYSRIKKGELIKVISEAKWVTLARILGVKLGKGNDWVTVKTETYNYITAQLVACQERSMSAILCDISGIGKSHTAKEYARTHKNAVYIDCSQVKSKQKLVRKIAQELGVEHTGRYADIYEDLVFYIQSTPDILIILDEAGDLSYEAFLELKALWNATEYTCGWYMMGADGLEQKIKKQKNLKKVGYTEIFDRYGNSFRRISPNGSDALKEFKMQQVAEVAKANNSKISALEMYAKTKGSLRKVRHEIEKQYIHEEN